MVKLEPGETKIGNKIYRLPKIIDDLVQTGIDEYRIGGKNPDIAGFIHFLDFFQATRIPLIEVKKPRKRKK